jgi:hypothetical protein
MPTVIRRKRVSRTRLGPYRRHELLFGKIMYPVTGYTGYGDGSGLDLAAFIDDEMAADWDNSREELMTFWKSGKSTMIFDDALPWLFDRGDPRTLPWAARMFDKAKT